MTHNRAKTLPKRIGHVRMYGTLQVCNAALHLAALQSPQPPRSLTRCEAAYFGP
jgi:hypothetical protein